VSVARKFLGRYFTLSGIIIHGDKLGSKLGFPTANIQVEETYKLIPADGVYAVYVTLENVTYQGMLNIGNRPTVEGHEKRIEVNIFDFDQKIYGKTVTISFVKRIRDEKKFDSLEALSRQLSEDRLKAIELLK
jgi:riboflavin kinase/FMN adenylyltransferase